MGRQYHAVAEIFRRTDGQLRRCIGKKLKTMEDNIYRSQHRLLMILGENPNCSQSELASILEISPAAVAVSLSRLEKNGYIKRETNSDDHRSNQVAITDKGDQVIRRSNLLFDELEQGMFDNFSEEEVELFYQLLQKTYNNLSRMLQEEKGED